MAALLDPYYWLYLTLLVVIAAMLYPFALVIIPFFLDRLQQILKLPRDVKTGKEGLVGKVATVRQPFSWINDLQLYEGMVWYKGELWKARSAQPNVQNLRAGHKVRIEKLEKLHLVISPEDQ